MKRVLILGALVASVAALAAGGVRFYPAKEFNFSNCSASGSSAQTVTADTYLFRVTDEDIYLCIASASSTCASGGMRFPVGTVMLVTFPVNKSVSCRSAGATGDALMTSAGQ